MARLLSKEVDKRLTIKLNRAITHKKFGVADGFMTFGGQNDYPQLIERLVLGSISAKSCRDIYSKFLIGSGFENEAINKIIVGNKNGKKTTLFDLLSSVCKSIAMNNGTYIHVNETLEQKIKTASIVPFKNCRFAKTDDYGYSARVGVSENWIKEKDFTQRTVVKWYPIYINDSSVFAAQIREDGGLENIKGRIFYFFLDSEYLYPLSPFDPVYLDADTDQQVSIFMNNQTRNGFTKKTVMRVASPSNEKDAENLAKEIESWQGVDGNNFLVLEDEFDENGDVKASGAFKLESIDSNINDKLFEGWQKSISNNIRKAVRNLPAILIDYEQSSLGTTSGEAIIQAANFYNAMTKSDRTSISEMFKELFSNSENQILAQNTNWNIKPLNLYDNGKSIDVQPAAGA